MTLGNESAFDFTGQVVLVTGGSRGIGRSIAQEFATRGAVVIACGRTAPAESKVSFIPTDVRDPEQVDALFTEIERRHGPVQVLINNAGGAPPADAATASPKFSEKIVGLNLTAALHCAQRANRSMQALPWNGDEALRGSIVNIASVSALRPSPGTAAYGAAKAALVHLTTSLAVEWAPKVRVNAISAGMIRTEMAHLHYGDADAIRRVESTVPLGRLGTPTDIAHACLFLSSPLASYVSGANLVVHGGGERPAFLDAADPSSKH